jgi:hypothetical protein
MAALISAGDEVLLERPAYEPLLSLAHYLGADVKRFDRRWEDGFRLRPSEIEKRISNRTRLIVITNFHNPTGVLTDTDILAEVGEIARKVNARVLVDEVYMQMLFETPPRTSFLLGNEFVVTSSLTNVRPESNIDPEPPALRYLRENSNFLTPEVGLMSADTWTFLAIYVRNLLLNWSVLIPLILGVLLSVTAVVGDLIESIFKREAKVKDSGRIFPGIGGILDLMDSLLFSAPLMYLYLRHILTA